jgi:hypothetical protein
MNRQDLVLHQNNVLNNQFWPRDGYCWHCKNDVLEDEATAVDAKEYLVTGCPWCNTSFVE